LRVSAAPCAAAKAYGGEIVGGSAQISGVGVNAGGGGHGLAGVALT